jgi:hypothetical protein
MRLSDDEKRSVQRALSAYFDMPAVAPFPSSVLPVARHLQALPVYVDIGGALLLRPDGTVLEVHSNQSWDGPVESRDLEAERDLKLARVAAARSWPTLASLAPQRPEGAAECATCQGDGLLVVGELEAYCRDCGGSGWV